MISPADMPDEYIAHAQWEKYYGRRRCQLSHETKYYSGCIVFLEQYFKGKFKRLEGHGEWGWPDLFGFDDWGRLQYVEVKMRNHTLRPMQREFYLDVANCRRKNRLHPGTWIIRIHDDRQPISGELLRWEQDEETIYERWNV